MAKKANAAELPKPAIQNPLPTKFATILVALCLSYSEAVLKTKPLHPLHTNV